MDEYGNGFDSNALKTRLREIEADIQAGIGRYWWYVLSDQQEWTHTQALYMRVFEKEGYFPHY